MDSQLLHFQNVQMDTQGCLEQSNSSGSGGHLMGSASAGGNLHQHSAGGGNGGGGGNSSSGSSAASYAAASSGPPSNNHQNPAVLALSTMLSSGQCLNLAEAIPDEALQLLGFFTDYGRLATSEAKDLGKPFQAGKCLPFISASKLSSLAFPHSAPGFPGPRLQADR
jgi:hypothetical protein